MVRIVGHCVCLGKKSGSFGMFYCIFSFLFLDVSFLFDLPTKSSFSGARIYHGYIPGFIWLQVIRDRMP